MTHLHHRFEFENTNKRFTFIGLSAGTIGTAALLGGGAAGALGLFGGGKKGKRDMSVQNPALNDYYSMIQPGRQQLMGWGQNRLGQDPVSFYPDILKTGEQATRQQYTNAQSGAAPYNALRENLLGEFDRAFEKYTLNPAMERAKVSGTYTGGEGANLLRATGTEGAQKRALLGSQIDVESLQNQQRQQQQAIANMLGYGSEEFNIGEMATVRDPIMAMQAAYGMQPPTGQFKDGVGFGNMSYENFINPPPNLNQQMLSGGASLLGPELINYLLSMGGNAAAPGAGTAIAAMPSLLGAFGKQGISSNYLPQYATQFMNFS